jgi:hypothetical protein
MDFQIPIAMALRSILNPGAPPFSVLEIGSGTAQARHFGAHVDRISVITSIFSHPYSFAACIASAWRFQRRFWAKNQPVSFVANFLPLASFDASSSGGS